MPTKLKPGLYDQPLDRALDAALREGPEALVRVEALPPDEAPRLLSQALTERLHHAFRAAKSADAQLELFNAVQGLLRDRATAAGAAPEDDLVPPARRLRAILRAPVGGVAPTEPQQPLTPLTASDLLVNGHRDTRLGAALQRELESVDRVDLLCSFVIWSGLRTLETPLRAFLARSPGGLRVLTTTYMGATEARAIRALIDWGADVRLSYDSRTTKLHAKAWLLERNSGFSTAFVGSSNLSYSALGSGLEWNVRLAAKDNPRILEKFRTTFEQYWSDSAFEPFDAERFHQSSRTEGSGRLHALSLHVDVEPRPHQRQMLDDLAAERQRGHHRNLVVAATGTGKTVVAALDYRRLSPNGDRTLLFVAHRKEILEQSLGTFRVVMKDGGFGELLTGSTKPTLGRHVLASVQSLHAGALSAWPTAFFDVIVVDEFHHAAAPSYERLLEHFEPDELLGLTATPERADGQSVLRWFGERIASEIRLWQALDEQLLCPFQYFGVGGAPDVSGVGWSRGRYDVAELSRVYTGEHVFAKRVAQEVVAKVGDVGSMRALGFCVDIDHAEFMAGQFEAFGIRAVAVSSRSGDGARDAALRDLRNGKLQVIFCVDLFNEGVDVPHVDTVIFLRPTESATVFLQQLGRGLRRAEGKACLTVLDFIGNANQHFRFDRRFAAILGGTRKQIARQIERGFPFLPAGCAIELDRQAQDVVLANVRNVLGSSRRAALVEDLRALAVDGEPPTLAAYLQETGLDLEDLYDRSGHGWTELLRSAGYAPATQSDVERTAERGVARMLHVDDPWRLDAFARLLADQAPPDGDAGDPAQRMLFVLLGFARSPYRDMPDVWRSLWTAPVRDELKALVEQLADRSRALTAAVREREIPLQVHGRYSLDEIIAGFDQRTASGGPKRIQTGVYHAADHDADLLFITLQKSASDYTPTTLYEDYPISATRFHWETQSNCHGGTETGARYLRSTRSSEHAVYLFVREQRKDARGETTPYLFLGRGYCAAHRGARPMQIEWDLERPMPAGFYQEAKLAGG